MRLNKFFLTSWLKGILLSPYYAYNSYCKGVQLSERVASLQNTIRDMRYSTFGDLPCLPKCEERTGNKPRFIVTLTSYGNRIFTTAPYAINSLFRQTILPDKIVLWLSEKTISPRLKELQEHGLEIRFCEDLKSYKKLIPALREFPDDVLVTADDDIYYGKNWFANFKWNYEKDTCKIYCQMAHEIVLGKDNRISPYERWRKRVRTVVDSNCLFPVGAGGILYPPNVLHRTVLDTSSFLSLAPTGDDIWFWAMARLQGTQHALVPNGYANFEEINSDETGEDPLWHENVLNGRNDAQIMNVLRRFPQIIPPPDNNNSSNYTTICY